MINVSKTDNNKNTYIAYLLIGQVKQPLGLLGWASWAILEEESEGQALKKRPGHPWMEVILSGSSQRTAPHYPDGHRGRKAKRLRFL